MNLINLKKLNTLPYIALSLSLFSDSSLANSLPINIKADMPYPEARSLLVQDGWKPAVMYRKADGSPSCWTDTLGEAWRDSYQESCQYPEIDNCSGTGLGFCAMMYFDGKDQCLRVITANGHPPQANIYSWEVLPQSTSPYKCDI